MNCVFHINGWPAGGKLTVSRALRGKIGGFEALWEKHPKFIDEPELPNHLVLDTSTVSPQDSAIAIANHMNILLPASH